MDNKDRELFIDWSAEMDMKYDCVLSIVDVVKTQYEKWKDTLPFYKNLATEGVTNE